MRCRVVCALREVMLIFWPTSALSSVDLPTLGLPTMATRPQRCAVGRGASPSRRDGVDRGSSWSFAPSRLEPDQHGRRGGLLAGAARAADAALAPGPARAPRIRRRRSACAPRPACRPRGRPAASFCGPAAIPAIRSSGPWPPPAMRGLISTDPEQPVHQRLRRRHSRRRGRRRRSRPPARRPGSRAGSAPPERASPSPSRSSGGQRRARAPAGAACPA